MTEPAALDWTPHGPRSRRFEDVYFSSEDGLAESRLVFLQGCGLPEAWRGRDRFVVGELGFGAGLNAITLLDLWRRERPAGARLHLFSVEAYPITAAEAARALAAWPELADLALALVAQWPDGRRGFQRIDLEPWGATLDLAVMDARLALQAWSGAADAWFLDGFAPARNPEMWSPELMALVAARSAPGARAATYTVARGVRDGLAAAGFAVEKRPGFGRKRERLEGRLPGTPSRARSTPSVAIVGGGIAGAALARAFAAEGVRPTLIEADALGAGASGNPAALVTPWLDAGLGSAARLYAQAFARAVELYGRETPDAVVGKGALQLERRPADARRFDLVAAWDGFAPGALERRDATAVSKGLGEPDAAGALLIRNGLAIEPRLLLSRWTEAADVVRGSVASLERAGEVWRLLDGAGELLSEAEVVCLATGLGSAGLAGLPALRPVRGQASWAELAGPVLATAWGGYAIPTPTGVLFGATHSRGDTDTAPREEDDAANLRTLAEGRPALATRLAGVPLQHRAAIRASTPDHLPLAGAVPGAPGLFILAGLGGRGFTLAPLLAEHVTALVLGAPSPLPRDLAALVRPERFTAGERGAKVFP